MIHIVARADQSLFLAAECNEHDGALWFRTLRGKHASQLNQRGGAGGVVIRAVMNAAFARSQTSLATASQMVIVRADDDCFVLHFGIAAGQNTDDVEGSRLAPDDI